MKLTRAVTVTAMAAVAALLFAGCSGSGSSGSTSAGSITVWADPTKVATIKQVVPAFEKANNVTVNIVSKPSDQLTSDVTQQAPTGKGPDVFMDAANNIGGYADNGIISPVTLSDPSSFEKVGVTAVTYKDQTWGMPISLENVALLVNTSLTTTVPTTFDQMISTGQALVSAGKAKYPFFVQQGTNGASDPYHMYPFTSSFGINVYKLKSDGSFDTSTIDLGGTGGANFANWLAAEGKAGILNLNYTYDIGLAAFTAGQVPYFITGPWALPTFKGKVNYSINPIPSAGGSTAAPFVGVQAFFVNKYSKNGVIAAKFLDYLSGKDEQIAFYKAGLRAPALTAAFDAVSSDTDVTAFGKVAQQGVPFPNTTAFNNLLAAMGNTEGAIIAGKSTNPAGDWQAMVDKQQAAAK